MKSSFSIMYDMGQIGSALRRRRRELGYTQADIAMFCGFSKRLIGEIERGRGTVGIEKVLRYANGVGIDFALVGRG